MGFHSAMLLGQLHRIRFILGVFGLLAWGYAGICAFGHLKARNLFESPKKADLLNWFAWNGWGAAALGLVFLAIAWRIRARPETK